MAKKNKIEDKIAQIGNFTEPKEKKEKNKKSEVPKEEIPKEEVPSTEEKPKLEELTPEEIKEKIIKLITEVASRGLSEEEKTKFIDDFKFFNGVLFEILDISNNLKGVLERTSFTLTPGQALLIYLVGTGALVVLLRKDLQDKIFKKEKVEVKEAKPVRKKDKKPVEEEEEEEEGTPIPKEAPKPKL